MHFDVDHHLKSSGREVSLVKQVATVTLSALTSNASTFPTVVGAVYDPGFATIKLSMDGAEAAVVIISLLYFF